jgi:hypothetical protein
VRRRAPHRRHGRGRRGRARKALGISLGPKNGQFVLHSPIAHVAPLCYEKKKKKKKKKKEKIFLVELKKHTMQQKKALGLLIRTGRRNRMHCNSHDPKTSDKRPNVRQLLHNVLAAGAAEETRHLSKTNNKFSISI